MPKGFAARLNDPTAHGGTLVPGPPSMNVTIGGQPAWLGMTPAAVAALVKIVTDGLKNIADKTAKVTAAAALPPPGGPAALLKAQKDLAAAVKDAVSNAIAFMTSSGVSMNICPVVKVLIPDGNGVVITPSNTVLINNWGACRVGDTIQEATSVNVIAMGCPTVIIGG